MAGLEGHPQDAFVDAEGSGCRVVQTDHGRHIAQIQIPRVGCGGGIGRDRWEAIAGGGEDAEVDVRLVDLLAGHEEQKGEDGEVAHAVI